MEQTSGHQAATEPRATRGGRLPTGVTALAPVPAVRRGEDIAVPGRGAAECSVTGVRRRLSAS
ncbi:hypothetical protein AB0E67_11330 [Streptomyces sp. NPDC032161]|uniref:hypothetical protein n=1 Tax=unclassified Streptomyces TaxID=2593676 RepID=UPI003403735E